MKVPECRALLDTSIIKLPELSRTSIGRRLKPFSAYPRYYLARMSYWVYSVSGGPEYSSEITYWRRNLKRRSPSLFDHQARAAAFPQELRQCISDLRRESGRTPELLEVGSGPVSILAAGAEQKLCAIVAVDPLATIYRDLLRLSDIAYPIEPIPGNGESLIRQFSCESFDIVYSSNALDHARSPRQCLEQICGVLRPGGFLLLEGFEREGSHGHWTGLHQHDLFVEGEVLVHMDRTGRRTDLTAEMPLTCISKRICAFKDRNIQSFGYELPANLNPMAPESWLHRAWYTILFRRERIG